MRVDVDTGGNAAKDIGLELGLIQNYSRNGVNMYLTTSLSARQRLVKGLTGSLDIPFTHLRTEQQLTAAKHIYETDSIGDITAGIRFDFASLFERKGSRDGYPVAENEFEDPDRPSKKPANLIHAILGISLTAPSGRSSLWYEDEITGERVYFPPEAQGGTGLWKPGASLTLFRAFGDLYPILTASYTYGRMENPIDYVYSDVANFGGGFLAVFSKKLDLRATCLFLATLNVHQIRYYSDATASWVDVAGSSGWMTYASLDVSIKVYQGLSFECGGLFPVYKTITESPNDLDFLVKGGFRLRV